VRKGEQMGCGASSTAATSVLEPRQIDAMRDMAPHREVANITPTQQTPLRIMRPQNSEALERRAKFISHDMASPQTATSTTATQDAKPAATQIPGSSQVIHAGITDQALQSIFSPRVASPVQSTTGVADGSLRATSSPGKSIVQPRRHSAQRRAIAVHRFAQGRSVEQETIARHSTPAPASAMRVSEHRGKQPQVMSSTRDGEGFLPRKLPPIRRTWMTSLGDLPPIEKLSPPRQLAAGLARARDEAVQNAAVANAVESQARVRAENYARRNADIEKADEFRASMEMFREMHEQNDVALASLATESSSAMAAVHDGFEMAQVPAELSGSIGKMSLSCGTGSLDLDLLELSTSSLSLSQELEHSNFHYISRFGHAPSLSAAEVK